MNDEDNSQMNQSKRLVLHFDVDTALILANDSTGSLTKEQALNRLLAEFAWGRVETNKDDQLYWKLVSTHFQSTKPAEDTISYYEYVCKQHTELAAQQIAFDTFCRSSSPGMKLKPEYDRLLKNITLTQAVSQEVEQQIAKGKPTGTAEQQGILGNASEFLAAPSGKVAKLLSDGRYQILPGFFRMVNQLNRLKRNFQIVFHSFEEAALKSVITEFNSFCRGEHLAFNGKNGTQGARLDGQKGSKNLLVVESSLGTMNRYNESKDLVLVTGSLKRASKTRTIEDEFEKELEEDSVTLHKGIQAIHTHLAVQSLGTLGIVHDKSCWVDNSQKREFAKPLLIDQQDFESLNIFFQAPGGHQETEQHGSVDIRDAVTGSAISVEKASEKYLVSLTLLDMIRDPDYLLKQVDVCEKNRNDEIFRLQNGIEENAQKPADRSGFEILQEQGKAAYLRDTVMPLLYLAFQVVDVERPADPIAFIAQYCLKNQDRVRIPAPNEEYLRAHREKYAVLEKLVKPEVSEKPIQAIQSPEKPKK